MKHFTRDVILVKHILQMAPDVRLQSTLLILWRDYYHSISVNHHGLRMVQF